MSSLRWWCVLVFAALAAAVAASEPKYPIVKRQGAPGSGVLTDFQVYEPVLSPVGPSNQYGCVYTQTLMAYDFANSYGAPFIGNYTPPPCSFNRVTINFTVTSSGRQFDRLALMYLGDTEVWRTSTAEPTTNGIIWTYVKEMQQFNALWQQPQKIIFDLGNLVNDEYTGIFHTTLTATFFTIPDSPPTADQILPISAMQSAADQGSVFQIPNQNATTAYSLPDNVERAVVSLAYCGQINEEFWYSNVFNSDTDTFANSTGALLGQGPWREVQLLIDDQLVGVAWPFPIIFTGGIVPGFWRPIVGIDAFDLRESEIDITAYLPLLLDGASHVFEIRVASLNDDGQGHATLSEVPGSYWLVSGKIFLFLDQEGSKTTGTTPTIDAPEPVFSISSAVTQNATGANETLTYSTSARRTLSITSTITTSSGSRPVTWTQALSYENFNQFTNQGLTQYTSQNTTGSDAASAVGYAHTFSYPIIANTSFNQTSTTLFLAGNISRGLDLSTLGPSVFPSGVQNFNLTDSDTPLYITTGGGSQTPHSELVNLAAFPAFGGAQLSTAQQASAEYFSAGNSSFSFGTTAQQFSFAGTATSGGGSTELYTRNVESVNNTIVYDEQQLAGQTLNLPTGEAGSAGQAPLAEGLSVKSMLGRGRGANQKAITKKKR